ncbi:MAG: hypothetical protein NTY38_10450 [Acidobacteria bacterium]|nr:hypothetical protein [Acidobacteriota bacterium]
MRRRLFLQSAAGLAGRQLFAGASGGLAIRWKEGAGYPGYVKGGAMGVVDGVIVYAGGMTQPWRETEAVWSFEPEGKDWKPLPPMPEGRAYTQGSSAMDSLIVAGGRRQRAARREVFRLRRNPAGEWKWDTLPSLNQGRMGAAVAAAGPLVLAVGGGDWDNGAFQPKAVTMAERLDLREPDAGWKTAAAYPGGPRASVVASEAGGKIYAFGGYDLSYPGGKRQIQIFADAWCYQPDHDRWEKLPPSPAPLYGGAAATVKNRWVVIGGGIVQGPDGTYEQSVIVDAKRHLVMGQYSSRVLVFDTETRTYAWCGEKMPRGHNDVRMCSLGDRIYALGGENTDLTLSNTTNDFLVGTVSAT